MSDFYREQNTQGFSIMAWLSFAISLAGTLVGIYLLEASLATKGFFLMSYLFSVSSCFTVAKVVRDSQETNRITKKIEQARTEKLLTEYAKAD